MKIDYKTPCVETFVVKIAAPVATSPSLSGLRQVKDIEGDWDDEF